MTHVDPFAPADSRQHPGNFGRAEQEVAVATLESAEEIEYRELFEAFGYAHLAEPGAEPVTLEELRALAQEFSDLWEAHATQEEKDGILTDDMPDLLDLRARAKDATGAEVQADGGTTPAPAEVVEPPKRPAKSAPAAAWHAYAKLLDPDLTDEDLKAYTVAGIQEFTAAQDGTATA